MDEIRTPNLYLAAYLLDAGEDLLACIPMENKLGRALFVFKASKNIPRLVNVFLKGEARVEPRSYSLMIKDLKAKASYETSKDDSIIRNSKDSNVFEQISESSLGIKEDRKRQLDQGNNTDLDKTEETQV